jgi:hypothetical protein
MTARHAMGALLAGVAIAFAAAAPAHGATYAVEQGTDSSGAPIASPGWSGKTSGASGPISVSFGNVAQGTTVTMSLAYPGGVTVPSATVDYHYEAYVSGNYSQPQITSSVGSWGFPYTGTTIDPNTYLLGYLGDTGSGTATRINPSGLYGTVSCVAGPDPTPGTCGSGGLLRIDRLRMTASESTAPSILAEPASGGLLGAASASGWMTSASGTLAVRASDIGSGVYLLKLREGASTVATVDADPASATCTDIDPGAAGTQFVSLSPCATSATDFSRPVTLSALGDGVHALRLVVVDAAGNETTSPTSYTVKINAPGGALEDPGTPCSNGAHDDSGTCITRPPSRAGAPILGGDSNVGGTLTTDDGAWNDVSGATYTYGWELCDPAGGACHAISGQSGPSLDVVDAYAGATIRSVVTATTNGGSTQSRSAVTPIVLAGTHSGSGGSGGLEDLVAPARPGAGGVMRINDRGLGLDLANVVLPVPAAGGTAHNGDSDANEPLKLTATLASGGKALAYGSTSTISGVLATAGSGYAVRNAQVDVIVHVDRKGAVGSIAGAVKTDREGRFTFSVPAGPSRIYSFGYRTTLRDTTYASVTHVAVAVSSKVSLRSSASNVRTGAEVTFSGTVAGASTSSRKLVQLQVRRGRRWSTFATTRLKNGVFAYAQRFTRTARTTTYVVRARVERDATWPLATGQSKPIALTVHPAPPHSAHAHVQPTRKETR